MTSSTLPSRVSARDSGKAMLDAILGEVIVTCEKIHWLCNEGERWLKPEKRSSGILSFYKSARVEYHPVGVVSLNFQEYLVNIHYSLVLCVFC
jgi:acyl-CoA reductase-like NAD-dependent aldehyde dehydrogenase